MPQPQPAAAAVRCSPTGAIRIVLPGWRHVEVEPGFDEMTLARTVQVLESLPSSLVHRVVAHILPSCGILSRGGLQS